MGEQKAREKFILDACCGGRMMWLDKHHPNTVYIDNRVTEKGIIPQRPEFCVQPDIVMDFRKMSFPDSSFKLVVWDPPHGTDFSPSSIMAKKFGVLAHSWRQDLTAGFREIWRVLEDYGVLVFKWNDVSIPYKEVLELFAEPPLFYNISAGPKTMETKGTRSYWFCFMKIPQAPRTTLVALDAPDEPSEKKPLLSYEDIRAFAQDSAPYASFVEEGVRWARDESVKWFLALLPTDAELERRYSGYVIKMVREDAIREAKFTRDEIKKRLEAGK